MSQNVCLVDGALVSEAGWGFLTYGWPFNENRGSLPRYADFPAASSIRSVAGRWRPVAAGGIFPVSAA
jgi:hypothetical protein